MQKNQETLIVIKVIFNNSIYNFGNKIQSYADLTAQTKKRFSQIKNFYFNFKEKLITVENFPSLLEQQKQKMQKSIKIQMKEGIRETGTKSTQITQKSKKFSFNQKDFQQVNESNQNQIIDLEKQFFQLKIAEKQFSESVKGESSEDKEVSIKFNVIMQNELSNVSKHVGEEYTWSCCVINQNSEEIPKGVFIKQIDSGKLIDISNIKNKQQITFGPFVENLPGLHTKLFQLEYRKKNGNVQLIGNRFGFVCETSKKLPVKEIENNLYKRVNQLKNFTTCEKSTKYIVEKLKDLGIDEQSIKKYTDQSLIEIIEQIRSQKQFLKLI